MQLRGRKQSRRWEVPSSRRSPSRLLFVELIVKLFARRRHRRRPSRRLPPRHRSGTLNGSGSTFQLTFQQAAISAFKSISSGITVNYGGVGSGTGRTDLYANTVNFAGSDSPIPATERVQGSRGQDGAVLPGPDRPDRDGIQPAGRQQPEARRDGHREDLPGQDHAPGTTPRSRPLNPGANLPGTPITLAVRSDSSGTTQNFSLFLQDAAGSAWTLGSGSTIKWPSTAHAANGNGGVAPVVKSTPGAIGYVDYSTAKASGLSAASIKNKAGNYVAPSTAARIRGRRRRHVALGPDVPRGRGRRARTAYPITYQSWDLVYAKQPNANDAALLKAYLGYLLGAGPGAARPSWTTPRCPPASTRRPLAQLGQITS